MIAGVFTRNWYQSEAAKSYAKAIERGATPDEIMDGLRRHLPIWGQFADPSKIPHVTTWLNQERWTVENPIAPVSAHTAQSRSNPPGPMLDETIAYAVSMRENDQ
jgi:hypothetical protein